MAERPIVEILKAQDGVLDRLAQILKNEFALLKERKALDLTKINEEKSQCLLDLQQNDQSLRLHSEKERLATDLVKNKELFKKKN